MDIKVRAIGVLGRARDEIRKELAWAQLPLATPEEVELVMDAYTVADEALTRVLEGVLNYGTTET